MKACVLRELKQPLQIETRDLPEPGARQARVELRAAALNRRDYWITQGLYPDIRMPVVLGSDGAGVVSAVGDGVDGSWVGREVVINPGLNWGDDPGAQSEDFRILGMPDDGTFASAVCVDVQQLCAKPDHLDWFAAAALPLAGLTAYRAVFTQGGLQPGQQVLVTGAGGGVAGFAAGFAAAAGAKVFVTSSSQEKIEKACSLGAHAGFDYTQDQWTQAAALAHGPMDLIVDGAGGEGYGALIELLKPGGRIVNYGATAGAPPKLDLFKLFWKQIRIVGSTMGSPEDFSRMIEFVGSHGLGPAVDCVLPLSEVNAALARMGGCDHFGKIVLKTAE